MLVCGEGGYRGELQSLAPGEETGMQAECHVTSQKMCRDRHKSKLGKGWPGLEIRADC